MKIKIEIGQVGFEYVYNYISWKMTLLDKRHFGNQIVSEKIADKRVGLLRKKNC